MEIKIIAPIILLVVLILAASGCTGTSEQRENIKVESLEVVSEDNGIYSIKGKIIPLTNFDYLEIVLKWYDAEGSLIQTDPLAWNINNVKANQPIKFSTHTLIDAGKPAKVELMIFKSPFSGGDESSYIYKTTLNV